MELKKVITFVLSFLLCLSVLTACGGGTPPANAPGEYKSVSDGKVIEITTFKNDDLTFELTDKANATDITWKSNDESVIKPKYTKTNKVEKFYVYKSGTAEITAKQNGNLLKTLRITVAEMKITSSVERAHLFVNSDTTFDLSKKITVTDDRAVEYTSNREDVATVDRNTGVVTVKGIGVANINIKEPKTLAETVVAVQVHSKEFYSVAKELKLSVDQQLAVPVISKGDVEYTSSNETVAKVVDGKVVAYSKGDAVITANSGDKNLTFNVNVVDTTAKVNSTTFSSLNNDYVNFFGRNSYSSGAVTVYYGTAGFEVQFYGTELKAQMKRSLDLYDPYLQVLVDGDTPAVSEIDASRENAQLKPVVLSSKTYTEVTLVSGLTEGLHTVRVLKRSPWLAGTEQKDAYSIKSVKTDGYLNTKPDNSSKLKIEVYGDSITCGYGNLTDGASMLNSNSNGLLSYHYQAAQKLDAEINVMGHSGWGVYIFTNGNIDQNVQWYNKWNLVNGKDAGEWNFDNYQADIVVINLGTNDSSGLGAGTYNSQDFIDNYVTMIKGISAKYSNNAKFILSYGMMGTSPVVWNDIKAVKTQLDTELGANMVYTLNFTDYRGGKGGHPVVDAHIKNGNELYNFIIANGIDK